MNKTSAPKPKWFDEAPIIADNTTATKDDIEAYDIHFTIMVWPGAGYGLNPYIVLADNIEDALNSLVGYLADNEPGMVTPLDSAYLKELRQDAIKDGKDEDEYVDESFYYTEAGYIDNTELRAFDSTMPEHDLSEHIATKTA